MARRPIDYTTQMQATEERRRLQEAKQREEVQRERDLRDRQAKSYGEVVREVFERGITIDALAALLLDGRERLQGNPELEAEWAARGADYFRPAAAQRKQTAGTSGTAGKLDSRHGDAQHGDARYEQSPATAPALPSRARVPATAGAADLLGSLATDQPGQSTPAEGGSSGG